LGFRALPLLLLAVLALPGTAGAMKVEVYQDRAVDFSRYRTYAWGHGRILRNPEAHARLLGAIEARLDALGLQKGEHAAADLVVTYTAIVREDGLAEGFRDGLGYATAPGVARVGTVSIELTDRRLEKVVWAGVAGGVLKGDLDRTEKRIRKALRKMFASPPPGWR
jgi:hypothetical protein